MNTSASVTAQHPSAALPLPEVEELRIVQYRSNAGRVLALYNFAGDLRISGSAARVSVRQAAAMLEGRPILATFGEDK